MFPFLRSAARAALGQTSHSGVRLTQLPRPGVARPFEDDDAVNDPAQLRIMSRLSMDYVISIYSAILRGSPHDPLDTLILCTVAVANVAHLNTDRQLSHAYAGVDAPEPAEIKRPISRNAVALSLGLPYETARRRVEKLLEAGALVERDGGLIGANEEAQPEMVKAMAEQNAVLLRRLVRQLRDQGIEI